MFITTILRFKVHPSSSLQARALTTSTRSTPSPPLLSSVQVTSVVSRSHAPPPGIQSSSVSNLVTTLFPYSHVFSAASLLAVTSLNQHALTRIHGHKKIFCCVLPSRDPTAAPYKSKN
ncbi:LOW QUALITY PROTEIN: hypothetical protein YC2023_075125 [Brassica napus]